MQPYSLGAHPRTSLDPGATVLRQARAPGGTVVPPHSPSKAPGATIQLDGTISLNHANTTRDNNADSSNGANVRGVGGFVKGPNGVEHNPNSKPGKPMSRSASWSIFDDAAPAGAEASGADGGVGATKGGRGANRLWSDNDSPQSLSVPLLVVLLYWQGLGV